MGCAATGVDLSATRDALLKAIAANATHSTTGIIGSSKLYQMLDAAKAHGTALSILSQTDYPSFGFEFHDFDNAGTLCHERITAG